MKVVGLGRWGEGEGEKSPVLKTKVGSEQSSIVTNCLYYTLHSLLYKYNATNVICLFTELWSGQLWWERAAEERARGGGGGEKRQTDKPRERQRQRDRDRETERDRNRERQRQRDTERDRQRKTDREGRADRERHRRGRSRERQTE